MRHLFEAVEGARAAVQLQMGDVVEEIELRVCVCEPRQVLEARRERADQLPQQIHMLLHTLSDSYPLKLQQPQSLQQLEVIETHIKHRKSAGNMMMECKQCLFDGRVLAIVGGQPKSG